jgi:hypothetical protein
MATGQENWWTPVDAEMEEKNFIPLLGIKTLVIQPKD